MTQAPPQHISLTCLSTTALNNTKDFQIFFVHQKEVVPVNLNFASLCTYVLNVPNSRPQALNFRDTYTQQGSGCQHPPRAVRRLQKWISRKNYGLPLYSSPQVLILHLLR